MEELKKEEEQTQTGVTNKIPAIRTYQGDVNEYIKKEGKTLADIAIAEQNRKSRDSTMIEIDNSQKKGWVIKILISLLILCLISLGAFFLYNFLNKLDPNFQDIDKTTPELLAFGIKTKTVNLDNLSTKDLLEKINDQLTETGEIYNLKITYQEKVLPAITILETLGIYVPSTLARSLKEDYALGTIGGGAARFLVLKISYYPNAFSGMLKWEEKIYKDLYSVLKLQKESSPLLNATSTSSKDLKKSAFYDSIISNRDSRVFKDANNRTLLIYTFIDNETIVIAPSENIIKNITEKLTIKR